MKTTSWKGIEIWTDFVWKIPKVEPEPPKKEESMDANFLEIDENWSKEEIELYLNKWKEDNKKYVEDQFAVMRQKLKTALDKIADLVTLPKTFTTDSVSTRLKVKLPTGFPELAQQGASLTEPTDEVGKKLYDTLQQISKAGQIEKRGKFQAPLKKHPELTLSRELKSASTVSELKSPEDAEMRLESVNWKPDEVENPSASATLTPDEVENPSASATLTPDEVENPSASATLTADEVENSSPSATLTPDEVENPSASATLTADEVENSSPSAALTPDEVENLSASATLTADEVENSSPSAALTRDEVENSSASATLTPDEVKNPSTSAPTRQNTSEDATSRSVHQTILPDKQTNFC